VTHRGPFQPLLFCDSVIQNEDQLRFVIRQKKYLVFYDIRQMLSLPQQINALKVREGGKEEEKEEQKLPKGKVSQGKRNH